MAVVDDTLIRDDAANVKPRMKINCATTNGAYAMAVTSTYSIASRL